MYHLIVTVSMIVGLILVMRRPEGGNNRLQVIAGSLVLAASLVAMALPDVLHGTGITLFAAIQGLILAAVLVLCAVGLIAEPKKNRPDISGA